MSLCNHDAKLHHCIEYKLKLLKSQQRILRVCKNKHLIYIISKKQNEHIFVIFLFLQKTSRVTRITLVLLIGNETLREKLFTLWERLLRDRCLKPL